MGGNEEAMTKPAAEPIDLEAIRERRQNRYSGIGNREHRSWHEKHMTWPEELHDCGDCEDEYEEQISAVKEAMLADTDALLAEVDRLNSARADLAKEFIEAVKQSNSAEGWQPTSGDIVAASRVLEAVARAHGIEVD